MIQEQYVSFETAKLLKEKGFNEDTSNFYNTEGKICKYGDTLWIEMAKCPTQSLAMQWLREEHNLFVIPKPDFYGGFFTGRIYDGNRDSISEKDDYIACAGYDTYEEAAEAAIKYCLKKLI